jgi:tartrate dehydrogenase/decarboxylase / D-malate dehydrogenase
MTYRLALIPGDGIGKEVIPEGVRVLEALGRDFGFGLEFEPFDYSCQRYLDHGAMMPPDAIAALRASTPSFSARSARRACLTMCRCGGC